MLPTASTKPKFANHLRRLRDNTRQYYRHFAQIFYGFAEIQQKSPRKALSGGEKGEQELQGRPQDRRQQASLINGKALTVDLLPERRRASVKRD